MHRVRLKNTENPRGCLVKLRQIYSPGSASQRVVSFILENPEEAVNLTVADLSKKCEVGKATIIRLCKSLGYSGFVDFKMDLIKDIASGPADIHEDVLPTDEIEVIAEKVFRTAIQTLSDTYSVLDQDALSKVIDSICEARHIEIYGVGASGYIAEDTYHKLLTIGIQSTACIDSHLQAMSACLLGPGDLAIGISHSGVTVETVNALRLARDAGARTVCITNYAGSPITKVADYQLFTASRERTRRGLPVAARNAQLVLLDAVYVGVAVKRYQGICDAVKRRIDDA